MAISALSKHGPNISSGDEIKFSTLRKYFLKMNPKTDYDQSDDLSSLFESETGSVSASQLLRIESFDNLDDGNVSDESQVNYINPSVPDCVDNTNIPSTRNDWKTSQFVGSVKYFYIKQSTSSSPTDDNLNLDINSLSWQNNLSNTIRKWIFVNGVVGSNDSSSGSIIIDSAVNCLTIKLSSTGRVYGASGLAGENGVDHGNGGGNGGNGGHALVWSGNNSNYNNYINLDSNSKFYAGGGGGGKGGDGGRGGQSGQSGTNNVHCIGNDNHYCNVTASRSAGGDFKIGGDGGVGRGYSNLTNSLSGHPGGQKNTANPGGDSGANGQAGDGGDFGKSGGTGNPGGTGLTGDGQVVSGSSTNCGPNPVTCTGYYSPGLSGGNGGDGGSGGLAGKAVSISEGVSVNYTLLNESIDNRKGSLDT